jgi:endonuclease/exonuclease/phosphatase (EEP) superfamily protein YafD
LIVSERVVSFAKLLVAIAAAFIGAAVVASLLPIWPCVLVEHFRVQIAIVGTIVAAVAFALRLRAADVAAIATLITLVAIVPDLTASRRPVPAGAHVRLLSLNVLRSNHRHAEVVRLIAAETPDVIALVEVNQRWLDGIAPAVEGYSRLANHDNLGVALFVRGKVRGEMRRLRNRRPNIFAEVTVNGATFRMVVVHPIPPVTRRHHDLLMDYFAELGGLVRGDPRVVVAGDFNATPWSRTFARMMTASGLCDSRAGFGAQTSFPANRTIPRIPIDHVLTSCAIGVQDRRIGSDVGSDHLPVIADLVVPP